MASDVEVLVADLDGDGRPEVVSVSSERVRWFQWARDRFVLGQELPLRGVGTAGAADLDGDGDLDLIAASSRGGPLWESSMNSSVKKPWKREKFRPSDASVKRSLEYLDR